MDHEQEPYQQHNLKEVYAATFVGSMLNMIRAHTLPHSEWVYDDVIQLYTPKYGQGSLVFFNLCYISDHIQQHVALNGDSFIRKINGDFLTAYNHATRDQSMVAHNILDASVRNGIIDIIWRIHDCIRFVEGKSAATLDEYVRANKYGPRMHYLDEVVDQRYRTRTPVRDQTWQSYKNEWIEMKNAWKKYLKLFDSVFPKILWDIDETLAELVQTHPREFWIQFWATASTQYPRLNEFQRYLIHTVAPQVLLHAPVYQSQYCQHALQILIDLNTRGEALHDFTITMSRESMTDALQLTDATIYPRNVLLGHDTLSGMAAGSFPDQMPDGRIAISAFYASR